MAEDERDGPSLELPSFGLGRRRGRKERSPEPETAPQPTTQETPTAPPPAPPEPPATVAEERPEADAEETVEVRQEAPAETVAAGVGARSEAARPLFSDEERLVEPMGSPEPSGGRRKAREPREPREAGTPGGMLAILATGLLVGALTVALTWLSQRGCEVVQGTSSCGDPGFLLLIAILVLMVVLGTVALRLARVSDPGSTSFLAVGLLTVVVLLFFVQLLFNWWMAIVVPVLAMVCFAASHWVTTAFVDPDDL